MLKLCSRLCFLVLATSSVSIGLNETTVSPGPTVLSTAHAPPSPHEAQTEATRSAADLPSTNVTTRGEAAPVTEDLANKTTVEVNNSTMAPAPTSVSTTWSGGNGVIVDLVTVAPATASTSSQPASGHSGWGYAILILIILVIIVLCVILYILRRVSRTYSFDLHRQVPSNHLNEPIGTFEPVYLDDLEQPAPKGQVTPDDLSPPPVSNGTTPQTEEPATDGESAPQEQPDTNGVQTSTSNPSPSLGLADDTSSSLSRTNLFLDAPGDEQQNENNNNPSVCFRDPFVEINLEEPGWCDQLFTSPEAPSSVLPFSPLSFSSSSSSSSEHLQ